MTIPVLNRVGMVIADTGTGDFTATTLISQEFLTPSEAGAVDGQLYWWLLQQGLDFQLFKAPWVASTSTVQRSSGSTVTAVSKISGTAGTSNLTLTGNAFLRTPTPAELLSLFAQGPASATDSHAVAFDGTTGSLFKDSGKAFPSGTIVGTSDTQALTNKDLTSGTNTFPTFNQNTTGSAATLTTARNIDGQAFDGSAAITVIAPGTHAATGKTTPVDADELPIVDSAASNVLKKLTWTNLKATLKTYFDTLYCAITNGSLTNPTVTNYVETVYDCGSVSTVTIDWANGTWQKVTSSANLTITLPSAAAGKSGIIDVYYGGTHTLTWAGGTSLQYVGGTAPTSTSATSGFDRYIITSKDTSKTGIFDGGRNIH